MAQLIMCDSECSSPAYVMWTEIESGQVQAYCADHLAEVCGAIAQEAGIVNALVGQALAAMEAAGQIVDPTATPLKRGRKAAAAAVVEPDAQPAAEPADAQPVGEAV